jgi:hypothetical protein
MNASEYYAAGRLQDAIRAQTDAVRADAADPNKRLFLFELQAFAGDLDRARRQLDAVKYDDPQKELAIVAYRPLLDAEQAGGAPCSATARRQRSSGLRRSTSVCASTPCRGCARSASRKPPTCSAAPPGPDRRTTVS